MKIFIIFGDHLFPISHFKNFKDYKFLMIESKNLSEYYNYHKIRLAYLFSSARHKFHELKEHGHNIDYISIQEDFELSYIEKLNKYCKKNKVTEIHSFIKEDLFFRNALNNFSIKENIKYITYRSPLFINSHEDFEVYLKNHKKPFLKTFYEESRKRYKILVTNDNRPLGGKWSFDDENRSKLKKDTIVPKLKHYDIDQITRDVFTDINNFFPKANGALDEKNFFYPVTRKDALAHLQHFLKFKLNDFGEFEDAISSNENFVFHSILSPIINLGLLTPQEVIEITLKYSKENRPPLNSLEGFIRQILGWREFVRGIYNNYNHEYEVKNFFNHQRLIKKCFYDGSTGILPLDNVIKKVHKYAYAHHIERLMILSNLMLLLEINPKNVHQYFSEMFIDSMDWVMGPNVFSMGQFSDGGIFATKPYICGSNYIIKMSDYKKDQLWCEEVDALYWSFIYKHLDFFKSQPRLSMMYAHINKMDQKKLNKLLETAERVKERLTYIP